MMLNTIIIREHIKESKEKGRRNSNGTIVDAHELSHEFLQALSS